MRKATLADMAQAYSDTFKELHGVRPYVPSWWGWNEYSDELQNVQSLLAEELRYRRKLENDAINSCMDSGCPDIATAMRWLEDAYEMEWV